MKQFGYLKKLLELITRELKKSHKELDTLAQLLILTILGCSLISLHNHSESIIKIEPETTCFVTIIFQYLHTP